MKNFNFHLFLLTVGVFFAYGQKDSSESESASKGLNDKTNSESMSEPVEKQVKKHNRQSIPVTPDEMVSVNQKLFRSRKPGFLEEYDRIPPVRISEEGKRQNVHLTDDSGRYNVHLENFQHERPTYFQAALGAISAHAINQKNEEYLPYPPNGDPYSHPVYGGHSRAGEPPVIGGHERSSNSDIDAPPLVDLSLDNPRRLFAGNAYRGSFPVLTNFQPGFYSGDFFNHDASGQVRSSEKVSEWYEDQRKEYTPAERFF